MPATPRHPRRSGGLKLRLVTDPAEREEAIARLKAKQQEERVSQQAAKADTAVSSSPYQLMPPLTSEEYAALEQSIAEHGVLTPVVFDENSDMIDGHHRLQIALKLGVHCPRRTVRGLTAEQKIAMALTLNIDRRHLTREQRRDLLAASLKAEPAASDREHARRTGSSDKTAGAVRRELEGRSEIPHVEKRIDTKGREQPALKPPPAIPKRDKPSTKAKSGERPGATPCSRKIQDTSAWIMDNCESLTDEQVTEALGAAQFLYELLRGEKIIREGREK